MHLIFLMQGRLQKHDNVFIVYVSHYDLQNITNVTRYYSSCHWKNYESYYYLQGKSNASLVYKLFSLIKSFQRNKLKCSQVEFVLASFSNHTLQILNFLMENIVCPSISVGGCFNFEERSCPGCGPNGCKGTYGR